MTYRPISKTGEGSVVTGQIFLLTDEVVANAMKAAFNVRIEEESVLQVEDEDIVEAVEITPPRFFVIFGRSEMGPQ